MQIGLQLYQLGQGFHAKHATLLLSMGVTLSYPRTYPHSSSAHMILLTAALDITPEVSTALGKMMPTHGRGVL